MIHRLIAPSCAAIIGKIGFRRIGELPFKHKHTAALLIAHLTQPPPDARDIRPDLPLQVATAIQRAMAKTPELRFGTAAEFAAMLGQSECAAG